ncbi:Uncharacterised protein [Helicobacter mustelae]|nr:Uncharacterised protein [Helicobacter mustelae]
MISKISFPPFFLVFVGLFYSVLASIGKKIKEEFSAFFARRIKLLEIYPTCSAHLETHAQPLTFTKPWVCAQHAARIGDVRARPLVDYVVLSWMDRGGFLVLEQPYSWGKTARDSVWILYRSSPK